MAMIETWVWQDLKQPVKAQYLDGNVFSQDNNGNLVGVEVLVNGEPATLSGDVDGYVVRADGVTVPVNGTLSGNRCYIVLPSAAYYVPGNISIVIKLSSTNFTVTLCAIVATVYQSVTDAAVDPGTIIPSIEDLIETINAVVASIPQDYSTLSGNVDDLMDNSVEQYGKRIAGAVVDLTDFNDALPNRVYTITKVLLNAPPETYGTLFTMNGDTAYVTGQAQIFVAQTGNIYFRILWGASPGTWTAWKNAFTNGQNALISFGERVSSGSSSLTDFNNALPNVVYTITTEILHAPPEYLGTLITLNGAIQYAPGNVQLFIADSGNLYFRILWGTTPGTWTAWKKANVNSISNEDYYSGIEMFTRFGVIGDSFASGTIYTPGVSSDREYYPLSWGQVLSRIAGNVCVNYSKGGYNTYDFTNPSDSAYNTYGLGKVLSDISGDDACGLYLLCLGINDSNNTRTYGGKTGGLTYLGSSADIDDSDPSQNANSFWGNYGKIISAIQAASPKSRIIMCTFARIPTTATAEAYDEYIEAIQDIAEYFDLPCITLTDDDFFTSSYYLNKMVGSHPTAPQYVGYAKAMDRLVSICEVNNYDYFKEYIGL